MPRARKPLSKEKRILAIEERLRNPEIADKEYASLNRALMILRGELVTYQKPSSKPEPKPEPPTEDNLPTWWNHTWERIFAVEHLAGCNQNNWSSIILAKLNAMSPEEQSELRAEAELLRNRNAEQMQKRAQEMKEFFEREEIYKRLGVHQPGQPAPATADVAKRELPVASKPMPEVKPPSAEQMATFYAIDALP